MTSSPLDVMRLGLVWLLLLVATCHSSSLASLEKNAATGNATAQFYLGNLYATGALGATQDPESALLNYYFSALGGNPLAQMALGYRYMFGLGIPKRCETSVLYYELAANNAVEEVEQDGIETVADYERLSLNAKQTARLGQGTSDEDLVDYYKHAAEKGDQHAQHTLGQYYYYGLRGCARDLPKAVEYFTAAALAGDHPAQASLGNMLVRGLGTAQDFKSAMNNFTAAMDAGNSGGMNGVGYMLLYGLGVEQNTDLAVQRFTQAAEAGSTEAYYNLGALYISGTGVQYREYTQALKYFTLASKKGHLLSMHKLAQMNLHGIGTAKSCESAAQLFKYVSERSRDAVNIITEAKVAYNNNDVNTALQKYLVGAEIGSELAQNNAAWLLDNDVAFLNGSNMVMPSEEDSFMSQFSVDAILGTSLTNLGQMSGSKDALRLFILSAEQGNHEARVKIGDYYYYAIGGVDSPDYKQAAHHYRVASEAHNTQAMFNLGYMHEYGIGLPRDFHLAKRFYDRASATSSDAHIPVNLALIQWWIHRIYRAIMYDDSETGFPGFVITFVNQLRYLRKTFYEEDGTEEVVLEDTATKDQVAGSEETPGEVVENEIQAEVSGGAEGSTVSTDLYDGLIEEDMMMVIFLCGILAAVVYIRQARQLR